MFEELQELLELSAQNNINLCRMGGMSTLLELLIAHPNDGIRQKIGLMFNAISSNNKKVQEFVRSVELSTSPSRSIENQSQR